MISCTFNLDKYIFYGENKQTYKKIAIQKKIQKLFIFNCKIHNQILLFVAVKSVAVNDFG